MFKKKPSDSLMLKEILYDQLKEELRRGNEDYRFKYEVQEHHRLWVEVIDKDEETVDGCYIDTDEDLVYLKAKWDTFSWWLSQGNSEEKIYFKDKDGYDEFCIPADEYFTERSEHMMIVLNLKKFT